MAEKETVSRIAKFLARATSDNENEAAAALKSAYARMKRDGVTMEDLLGLPDQEIYQNTLVRLIDLIVEGQEGLSHDGRRKLYSGYLRMVVTRFSGPAGEKEGKREPPRQEPPRPDPPPKREAPRQESPRADEKEFKRQYSETPKHEERKRGTNVAMPTFSFSPATIFSLFAPIFGHGAFFRCALRDPGRALKLIALSAFFGCIFSGAIIVAAALLISFGEFEPFGEITLKRAFLLIAIPAAIARANYMHKNGWFSYY